MMLLSRINRLEQRHTSGNPLEVLTDEEWEAAIEALNKTSRRSNRIVRGGDGRHTRRHERGATSCLGGAHQIGER